MLQRLIVNNYALIQSLDINFDAGLNIITGETGAGKSIILGALNLILGVRADGQSLLDKQSKCIVEGHFIFNNNLFEALFRQLNLDYDIAGTIRREITKDGKSRAFINDTPVTLSVLKQVTSQLIDIHSQRDHFIFDNVAYRYQVLDAFAGNATLMAEYTATFNSFKESQWQLMQLQEEERKAKSEFDYWQFQYNELSSIALSSGDPATTENDLKVLENVEAIKKELQAAVQILSGDDAAVAYIKQAIQHLQQVSRYDAAYEDMAVRLRSALIEIKDIADECEDKSNGLVYDEEAATLLNDKLTVLNKLLTKHNVRTTDELQVIKNELEVKLNDFSSIELKIETCNKQVEQLKAKCKELANTLFKKRKAITGKIESEVEKILTQLTMPDARFKIEVMLNEDASLSTTGMDSMQWLFQANKGHALKDLSKTASGGELSRLMLALQALLAQTVHLPTMIFDEIDTGVSGNVAIQVGNVMKQIALGHQVVTITHLPQIAAKGQTHFNVFKTLEGTRTLTQIKQLSQQEKVLEIARMIGGATPSQAAMDSALELMRN
ncbi:MAG: DNA repair protein RecN [Bacteroidetes bacterium]|nr:DNA repair protein RecN [Bacteroidota bacterium]